LQLRLRPCPTGREGGMAPGRQAPRGADEVGHAGLPRLTPALGHPIAIADQDPSQSSISAAQASGDRRGWII
jgi:hypothetical protein